MHHDQSRRRALAQLSAASLAGLAPWALAQKPLITVGFIYVGPKDDFGYNQAHAEAVAEVKKMAGIKVVEEENVPETQAVQKTMQGMISQDGATLLFPTSFGYFDPHMLAIAAKNPTCASPIAAACGPRASTRRTPAASSATSTRRSTSTAWSPAT
jgi:basic membrane protein A